MKIVKPLIDKKIVLPLTGLYLILVGWVANAMFRVERAPVLLHDKLVLIGYHALGFAVFFVVLMITVSQSRTRKEKV